AAATLMDRGYTELGFLGGPSDATSTLDREKGFLAEIALNGSVNATTSFASAYSFEAGRNEMTRLSGAKPAQAYFCGDDVLSIGALSALQTHGFRVPEDVGLIGLNNMEMSSWDNINLTTIHNPFSDIIAASIDRVAALIEDQDIPPKAHLFDCYVVERGTLRALKD
ncbi:MAG: DNA-binding LacI/PurR family transcriptional regulator, partial [Gammaproteobacteria bacterium]